VLSQPLLAEGVEAFAEFTKAIKFGLIALCVCRRRKLNLGLGK